MFIKTRKNNYKIRFIISPYKLTRCIVRSFFTKKYFENFKSGDKYFLFAYTQPEKSTNIDAPKYIDQIKVIQEICKYLPQDVYLYVKEHIHMDGKGHHFLKINENKKCKINIGLFRSI